MIDSRYFQQFIQRVKTDLMSERGFPTHDNMSVTVACYTPQRLNHIVVLWRAVFPGQVSDGPGLQFE